MCIFLRFRIGIWNLRLTDIEFTSLAEQAELPCRLFLFPLVYDFTQSIFLTPEACTLILEGLIKWIYIFIWNTLSTLWFDDLKDKFSLLHIWRVYSQSKYCQTINQNQNWPLVPYMPQHSCEWYPEFHKMNTKAKDWMEVVICL